MSSSPKAEDSVHWIDADKDYKLGLLNGKVVSQNPKGNKLASVPKWLKESDQAQQLTSLKDWLKEHRQTCFNQIEQWMLRSFPVPRTLLASVWPDPAWSGVLTNTVVCAVSKKGDVVQDEAGFLRDVDPKKGVGIIDLDGETQWLKSECVQIPHPILLEELDDFRELTVELDFQQKLEQLFRQTWVVTAEQTEAKSIREFSNGKFEALTHVMSLCRRLGYRVSGGYSCCPVWENGILIEARYWVGADAPEYETWTDELIFTDDKERSIPIAEVGPVAFSEGMRMASSIFAKRVVEKDEDDDN